MCLKSLNYSVDFQSYGIFWQKVSLSASPACTLSYSRAPHGSWTLIHRREDFPLGAVSWEFWPSVGWYSAFRRRPYVNRKGGAVEGHAWSTWPPSSSTGCYAGDLLITNQTHCDEHPALLRIRPSFTLWTSCWRREQPIDMNSFGKCLPMYVRSIWHAGVLWRPIIRTVVLKNILLQLTGDGMAKLKCF